MKITKNMVALAVARDADRDVRWELARHLSTPPEVLTALASDGDCSVRWAVAAHPSTPPEVLAALASDADIIVRWAAARHPSTSPQVLAALARDDDCSVRWAAAHHLSARGTDEHGGGEKENKMDAEVNERWRDVTECFAEGFRSEAGREPSDKEFRWTDLAALAASPEDWASQVEELGRDAGRAVRMKEQLRRNKRNAAARARHHALRGAGLRYGPDGWE